MKKILFFAAVMGVAFTSCMNEEFIGDQEALNGAKNGAIQFISNTPRITRADNTGSSAANDLSKQFIVWGEKNETAENVGTAAGASGRAGDLVFKNYVVDWVENSAYTTTSNTKDWEYVGLKLDDATATPVTTTYSTHISPNSGTGDQTIKYWDYGATSYTFTAVSALPADITAGDVTITKTETGATVYDKGYTLALTANAHIDNLFFSERQPIAASSNNDRTQKNTYGGNVTFRFHNLASKVRVAMYETIPGYSVTINSFKVTNSATPAFSDMSTTETTQFAANFVNNAGGTKGNLAVKYIASGETQNHPTVTFTPTDGSGDDTDPANILCLGDQLKANVTIGTTITGATYDRADGDDADLAPDYTSVFPKENNTQNLKMKVCYTMKDPVTNETIIINDATAEIPANYLKWKPGFAYTYIFKITDDKLYPITFDAVEVVNEDGLAEYITTVCEPSITTFGVKVNSSDAFLTYVAGGSDYQRPTGTDKLDIYATIVENGSVITPTEGTNVNYYSIAYKDGATAVEKTEKPITESSVAESIAEKLANPSLNPLIVCTKNNDLGAPVTTVPGEDGVNITGTNAVKFENLGAGIYAIEYITTQTYNTTSRTYDFADQTAFDDYVAANGTLYNDVDGLTETTWAHYNTDATTKAATYYHRAGIKKHAKTYKVITVTAAP